MSSPLDLKWVLISCQLIALTGCRTNGGGNQAHDGNTDAGPCQFSSPASARAFHTATLLSNGTVLLAGGDRGFGPLSTAELYNPVSGSFSDTGSMQEFRELHTATLLADGRVLVTGGWNFLLPEEEEDYTNTAELYDPNTRSFTLAATPMRVARTGHTATVLPNGRVLLAGSYGGFPPANDPAEVYDPVAASFTSVGNMHSARGLHAGSLLPNGKVLLSGGVTGVQQLATAELYNPDTASFAPTGSMAYTRELHTQTLLTNGKVLVTGGYVANAELYDPSTGLFSTTGSMSRWRFGETATLLTNGRVLVVGGVEPSSAGTAELYDPATGLFSRVGDLQTKRSRHTATLLVNGEVLIVGGEGPCGPLDTAELFDPATNLFTPASTMK